MEPIALLAVACPYVALDHLGRPQAVVPAFGVTERWIGASRDNERSAAERVHVFSVSEEPVRLLVNSPAELGYYRRFFQDGALIAGDEDTAQRAGVEFVPPAQALALAKARAAQAYLLDVGRAPPFAEVSPPFAHPADADAPNPDDPAPAAKDTEH